MAKHRAWIWLGRVGMLVGGLAVGLVVAELIFRSRDDGAFPHVNFYRADPALGVRLEPHAEQRIAFGGNPVTSLRTNGAGYRGGDWPASSADEIIVVGDSQVFGLGVEEDQTFSAKLAQASGRTVINAGVPTYGPAEYQAVLAELLAQRQAKTVVLTLNMVNDPFELGRPNRDRHAVWDGWAVRREAAPAEVTDFPLRGWLYRKSHLVFALRKWRHDGDPVGDTVGHASEGTWQDLVALGREVSAAQAAQVEARQATSIARRRAQATLTETEAALERLLYVGVPDLYERDAAVVRAGVANTGDIVDDSFGEEARSIVVTAELVRKGVIERRRLREELAAWAKKHKTKDAKAAAAALDARSQAMAVLTQLAPAQLEAALELPLAKYIREVQALCASKGARLVVAILPIDVQVSPAEWAKYGLPVQDLSDTRVFVDELVASTQANGVTAVDLLPALAAAEPGAFLKGDIHMTAKGHAAVATALAAAIAAPPPGRPAPEAASARTLVPLPAVWREASEIVVAGSTAAGCETKRVGEWLRVLCGRTASGNEPTGIAVERDPGGESQVIATPHQTALVTPLVPGREVAVKFAWRDATRVLRITWAPEATKPVIAFDAPVSTGKPKAPLLDADGYLIYERIRDEPPFASATERAICTCWDTVYGGIGRRSACSGVYGHADAACVATYATDCARLLECTRRDPASPPAKAAAPATTKAAPQP